MNVNSLLEGATPYQHQQSESAKLAGKWEKSGLLEGLNGHESEKSNMAVLLENQARQLINETNSLGASGGGTNIGGTGNSEAWAGVALPLVRRVFGEIVANDLVSVQPMNLPSGLIFYLDFQYGSDQPGFTSGTSLYAASSDRTKTELPTGGAGSGLYGSGRFGYSINEADSTAVYITSSATAVAGTASYASLTGPDSASVNFDDEWIAANDITAVDTFTILAADLPNFDPEGVRGFVVTTVGSDTTITNHNQFNTYDATAGTVTLFAEAGAALANEAALVVKYHKGPDNLDDRNDFEDGQTDTTAVSNLDIPTIDVKLNSDTVTAKTRKLKAQWTPEFAQDLNAYHSIDAEAELTSILSEYISMEIDLEILDMLIRNADTTNHWSAKVGDEASSTGVVTTAASNEYYTRMSWFQTLGIKLQSVSNTIHQKTLRGGANFMVVSPKVSTILESIPGFAADSPGDSNKYAMGVQKIGAINSRYTVYKNPYMTENVILMGYKGNQFLETGAVFAPYIPLIMTPLVYDPISFTPRKGIMTRYAKKMVRPDFYGKVLVSDLDQV
jgi:hypothetical protein